MQAQSELKLSLSRLYGDKPLLSVENRLKYINRKILSSKRSPLRRHLSNCLDINPTNQQIKLKDFNKDGNENRFKYAQMAVSTEGNEEKIEEINKTVMKSIKNEKRQFSINSKRQNFMNAKLKSQKYESLIFAQTQQRLIFNQLRKLQVQTHERLSRQKIVEYSLNKHAKLRRDNFTDYQSDHVIQKGINLKLKLLQEEQKSLNAYEEELAGKTELMRKIQKEIKIEIGDI